MSGKVRLGSQKMNTILILNLVDNYAVNHERTKTIKNDPSEDSSKLNFVKNLHIATSFYPKQYAISDENEI